MKVILGEVKQLEELEVIQAKNKRVEFWKEQAEMWAAVLIGAPIGVFAILGLISYFG